MSKPQTIPPGADGQPGLPGAWPGVREASQLLNPLSFMAGMFRWSTYFLGICLGMSWFAGPVWAGGSGLNTLVVINQNSANSLALGNYYCERRQVPPENVLRISWSGGNTSWDVTQFQTNLLEPLLAAIANRGLSNQIHYVVLSMDIPYQTSNGGAVNGTTSCLFYGVKTDTGAGSAMLTNSYFASENIFPAAAPATATGYSFLATMITATNLAVAKQVVDQGVASDATFPSAPVVLAKTSDPLRRLRYSLFDNALFNTRLRGDYTMVRTNSDSPNGLSGLLGYQTGLATYNISPGTFVPGAMADSLTSYGGIIFADAGQTSLLPFLAAGAAGSYGTVSEPTANVAKFPDPQNYFYQARGFSLAECYYQSIFMPYQGLVVGEPLAAPFASPGAGSWLNPPANSVLSGTAPLTVQFTAADAARPLQQVDLFVDGKFFRTVTNVVPAAGNTLKVRVAGQTVNYVVPVNATLGSIAAGLAAALNAPSISNQTQTLAIPYGDRVELRQLATNRPRAPLNLRPTTGSGIAATLSGPPFDALVGTASELTTLLAPARSGFLDSPAAGIRNCTLGGTVSVGTWLQLIVTKTNGTIATISFTNQLAGATPTSVFSNLFVRISAAPELQGADGLSAEDFTATGIGLPNFNLVARSPGLSAAQIKVAFHSSSSLVGAPATDAPLNSNLPDLQPRNHLYVNVGVPQLTVSFPLDTRLLRDGVHDLTAVAYEGSHVRTQTRVSVPVQVQNSSLVATLALQSLAATNAVNGSYSLRVTANATNLVSVTLYSTGGALQTISNDPAPNFTLVGTALGVGQHPIYAQVLDSLGHQYRTAAQLVRFQ